MGIGNHADGFHLELPGDDIEAAVVVADKVQIVLGVQHDGVGRGCTGID
jgi:hypothetical protein